MDYEIDICDYIYKRSSEDILVDLRDKIAFGHGSIQGSVSIPLNDIKGLYQLPKDKKIYVFCQKGEFSKEIVQILRDAGYEAYHLSGGYIRWLRYEMKHQETNVTRILNDDIASRLF